VRIGPAPANVAESVVMHRAGDGFVAASATFHSSIDLQLVSYSNYIALECTVVCVRGTEQTDRRTDESQHCLMTPTVGRVRKQ